MGAKVTVPADGDGTKVEAMGDPTDAAALVLAWKGGVKTHGKVVAEQPFTSQRRMASVIVVDEDGKRRSYVRGAPEALLAAAVRIRRGGVDVALDDNEREHAGRIAASWASHALRVIAYACRDLDE